MLSYWIIEWLSLGFVGILKWSHALSLKPQRSLRLLGIGVQLASKWNQTTIKTSSQIDRLVTETRRIQTLTVYVCGCVRRWLVAPWINFGPHIRLNGFLRSFNVLHFFDVVVLNGPAAASDVRHALLILFKPIHYFIKLLLINNLCHIPFSFHLDCTHSLASWGHSVDILNIAFIYFRKLLISSIKLIAWYLDAILEGLVERHAARLVHRPYVYSKCLRCVLLVRSWFRLPNISSIVMRIIVKLACFPSFIFSRASLMLDYLLDIQIL